MPMDRPERLPALLVAVVVWMTNWNWNWADPLGQRAMRKEP